MYRTSMAEMTFLSYVADHLGLDRDAVHNAFCYGNNDDMSFVLHHDRIEGVTFIHAVDKVAVVERGRPAFTVHGVDDLPMGDDPESQEAFILHAHKIHTSRPSVVAIAG